MSDPALDILMRYHFPGNVRELENIIQRAIALTEGEVITDQELPDDLQKLEINLIDGEGLQTLEEVERRHIADVLRKTGGNKHLASKILESAPHHLVAENQALSIVLTASDPISINVSH